MDDKTSNASARAALGESSGSGRIPKTDIGTVFLHLVVAVAFIVSLFTGVRIAADALIAPVSHWLVPILPQGDMWFWHFMSGLVLFFGASAYVLYVLRTGLIQRNAVKKTRVLAMPAPPQMKWAAVNVILHWFAYGLIAFMFATGTLLYLGYGGWWVYLHSTAAFVGVAYIFAHVVAHYMDGGWWQLLRIFNPARLVITKAVRPKPLLIGSIVGIAVVGAIAATDLNTRDQLVVARTSAPAPKLDGVIDDAIWKNAVPVTVKTYQGNKDAGAESSTVQVWAAHDGQKMYYAFKWSDPTRSMRRVPLIKREDGWHLLQGKHDRADRADVNDFYEDKLAVGITTTPSFGGGGSSHLGPKPLGDKAAPLHARGYHYTTDGTLVDVWQWKASRGGHLGFVDNQYFGAPRDMTSPEAAGQTRYQAGYWNDPGRAFYVYNFKGQAPGGYKGPVEVMRLPIDWQKSVKELGKYDLNPESIDEEGSKWWTFENESVPYSKDVDAKIPVGTVIPGVLIMGNYEGERARIQGAAKWKDGYWTLEMSRDLKTGGKFDHDFVPGKDLYMWLNVFDHTQTRHTRHQRPIVVVVKE